MTLVLAVLSLVVIVNCWFMYHLISNVTTHSPKSKEEPGIGLWIGIISFFQFLLSTFGISDFAMGSAIYSKLKWVSPKKLPGTLNASAVIPVAFMALIYITSIEVGLATLIVPIVAQVIGAHISPRFVTKMKVRTIRIFLSLGMFITVLHMVMEEVGLFPSAGTANHLEFGGLILLGILCFVYGALNNLGLGSFAPTMATVYALGLNPIAAFPIMMGAATFSVPVGSIQFIKYGSYSRKITIISAIFGTLGVLAAAFIMKDIQLSTVKWIIAAFLLFSTCSMLYSALRNTTDSIAVPQIEKKNSKLSAAGRLTGFCVLLVLLCAASLILIFIVNFRTLSYNYTETSIKTQNTHLIDNVRSYLSERENLLQSAKIGVAGFITRTPVDFDSLENYLKDTSLVLTDVSTLYCTSNEVWNKPGGFAVFSQPWDVPQDWDNTKRFWYIAAKGAQGDIAYSRPYVDALTGDIIMDMSCNVYNERGEDVGVVSMAITIEALNNMLQASADLVTGQNVYLIDSEGVFVVHSDKSLVAQKNIFSESNLSRYREEILGESDFYVENNGFMILSSSVANTGWYLISITPVKEILNPINDNIISMFMTPLFIIFFLLLIVLICLSVIVRGESEAKLIAERITREKNYFIARVSHEIRTPMNAVIGMSELARRDYGTPKGLEYIMNIKNAGSSLLTIINDILDFSKVESGHLELTVSPYETASMLNDVLALIRVRLSEKNLDFIVDIDPNLPKVMTGDSVRVKQVLINLLGNAVKYTHTGYIRLTIKSEKLNENESKLTFVIEDSGIGIKSSDMELLFGVFNRIDEKNNSNIEGTGLGLSIARNLCLAMTGDITAKSEYGKGSIFTATLIQSVTDWSAMGNISELSAARTGIQRVTFTAPDVNLLLVDDAPVNLLVAKGLLAPYEMSIDTCIDGREAIEMVKNTKYDLILMDHMMPNMDGVEATAFIRDMNIKTPIVALTANAVTGMHEFFLENGMNDFLSKPIDVVKLDDVLNKWIPKAKKQYLQINNQTIDEKQPVEIIKKIENQKDMIHTSGVSTPDLMSAFRTEAENAIKILQESKVNGDYKLYMITIHAMKASLANIGEIEASELASELEKAGFNKDKEYINENTPVFIKNLEKIINDT